MKICALIVFVTLLSFSRGVTKQDLAGNEQAKLTATDLFRSKNSAAALAVLQANLQSDPGPDGGISALVQGLIEISCRLYNRRELTLARHVFAAALTAAQPIFDHKTSVPNARGSELASSLGAFAEHALFDNRQAEALYNTASSLNPDNRLNNARRETIVQKQRPRGGTGRS